jgi:hypothetical protein
MAFLAGHFWVVPGKEGGMPPQNRHYTLLLINHETAERLKIELVDLPFRG